MVPFDYGGAAHGSKQSYRSPYPNSGVSTHGHTTVFFPFICLTEGESKRLGQVYISCKVESSSESDQYKYCMRKLIDIIMEAETLNEQSLDGADVARLISRALEHNETYIAHIRGRPEDDLLQVVKAASEEAGVDAKVVTLGHNCVGKELPSDLFKGGLVVLDILPHNLAMCLGEKGMHSLELQIKDADHGYPCSIIIIEQGVTQLSRAVQGRFPHYDYMGKQLRDIEDGGIHRIV